MRGDNYHGSTCTFFENFRQSQAGFSTIGSSI
jgi:hypothetical protein